jgi:hypothetical protein
MAIKDQVGMEHVPEPVSGTAMTSTSRGKDPVFLWEGKQLNDVMQPPGADRAKPYSLNVLWRRFIE